jgi:hypothetical protein
MCLPWGCPWTKRSVCRVWFAECVRESREAADQKLAELDALITAPVHHAFSLRPINTLGRRQEKVRSPLVQGADIWCELPVNNTDNTKNAQAPIFPAESGRSLQDPPDTKSQLLRRRRRLKGRSLRYDGGTESTHDREVNSEAFPRSKTHKDLKERPRESHSIMRTTSPTKDKLGSSSAMFEKRRSIPVWIARCVRYSKNHS